MVLTAHDLGSHIARSATGLAGVVGRQDPCYTEIGQAKIALVVKDEILRLDVSMDNELCVH